MPPRKSEQLTVNNPVLGFIRSCPLFRGLPDEAIAQLEPLSEIVAFRAGDQILTQGQDNQVVYILMDGALGVIIDGHRVAGLSQSGDLIGEMSVISSRPCSASIVGEQPGHLFCIRVRELSTLGAGQSEHLQQLFYRIYAGILAEKLRETNDKARKFEFTNEKLLATQAELRAAHADLEAKVAQRSMDLLARTNELEASASRLEDKNAALIASHGRLEELANTRSKTLQKVAEINQTQVASLLKNLDAMAAVVNPEANGLLGKVLQDVKALNDVLRPFESLRDSDAVWRSKSVLLAESDKKQQIIAKTALGGTGVKLSLASTVEEGQALISEQDFDVVCTNWELIEVANAARARNPAVKTVLMTSQAASEYMDKIRQYPFLSNVVSRNDEDRTLTVRNILTTIGKLVNEDIFGLDKYLSWGVEIRQRTVTSSESRWDLVSELEAYFQSLGIRNTIIDRCQAVAEELLSNAIYDAPVDAKGASVYNHLPRVQPIHLKSHEAATLRYACDGLLAAISVEDPFGAFPLKTILDYLESCYGGRAGSLNANKGGAGMGIYQIIENADLVIFNVKHGVRTEVIALFSLDAAARRFEGKSFHYFSQ